MLLFNLTSHRCPQGTALSFYPWDFAKQVYSGDAKTTMTMTMAEVQRVDLFHLTGWRIQKNQVETHALLSSF